MVVGAGQRQAQLAPVAADGEVAVAAQDLRGRMQAPAVVLAALDGQVGRLAVPGPGDLRRAEGLAERAAPRREAGSAVKAALHLHAERPGQGVETEGRALGLQVGPGDGDLGNQVPVHRVAERLVEARAALVDRQPLRPSGGRRGVEAAELQVAGEGVALAVGQHRPRQAAGQRALHRLGPGGDLASGDGVARRGVLGRRGLDQDFGQGRRLSCENGAMCKREAEATQGQPSD